MVDSVTDFITLQHLSSRYFPYAVLYVYTLGFTLTFLTQFIHCALCKVLTLTVPKYIYMHNNLRGCALCMALLRRFVLKITATCLIFKQWPEMG